MTDLLALVMEYQQAGLAAVSLPPASKRAERSWKRFQNRPPSAADLQTMFGNGPANVGVVCGRASNNLLVVDCESQDTFNETGARLAEAGIETWTTRRPSNGTPHDGGGHYWLRTPEPVRGSRVDTDLELKGQGQYVLAPPSEHPGGGYYEFITRPGDIYKLPNLSTLDWLDLKPVPPLPKRSRLARKLLAGDPEKVNSYPSRSEAEYALCLSLANKGFKYEHVRSLFCYFPGPGKFKELYARDQANAERYLYLTWKRATELAEANPGKAVLFARNAIHWAESRPWPGRTGATDRAVYLAHLSIVQKCGRQSYAASCRDLAELSGVSWMTATRATQRLIDGGLIELAAPAVATLAHRYHLLAIPSPNNDLPVTLPQYNPVRECNAKVIVAMSDTEHDTFRWHGLGKTGMEVLTALEAKEQATVSELAAATGRHLSTVRRKLKTLLALGMVERVSAYVWRFVGGDLDDAAEALGTDGIGERERQQHADDRRDHRQELEEGAKSVRRLTHSTGRKSSNRLEHSTGREGPIRIGDSTATGYRPGRVVVETGEIL